MKWKVLIVEDELITAENIKAILENNNYEVCSLADGTAEAWKIFIKEHPQLIICDIMLTGNDDGISFIKRVSKLSPIPCIYLTALADERTLNEAAKTLPFAYLVKPFIEKQLLTTVDIAIKQFYKNEYNNNTIIEPPTVRELEVIKLMSNGLSSKQIADKLFTSVHTVNTHKRNLTIKYDLSSGSDIIVLAIKRKWISV